MSPRTEKQFAEMREKTRAMILECALELFATKGFHGTAIGMIAKDANISKGLIYHYFDSKRDILRAIIVDGMDTISDVISAAAQISDPYQQIAVLIERTFAVIKQHEHHWKLYISLLLQSGVVDDFRDLFINFSSAALTQIETLFEAMNYPDPLGEARLLAAAFDGVALHFLLDKEDYPLDQIKNTLITKYSRKVE